MVSRTARLLAADTPAIATAHFRAEADRYHPRTNPRGYVNLGTAESGLMWDLLAPKLSGSRSVSEEDLRYGPLHGGDGLRAAIAGLLGGTWRRPVDKDDLIVVSGATAALDIAATVLCDPGEVIVVPAPYYSALDTDLVGRSGARLAPAPMSAEDGFRLRPSLVDETVTAVRRAGSVVRAIALTSPTNPQGHVHSAATLRDLLRVAAVHDLDVISDEIYAHSVFGPDRFVSVLDPEVLAGGVIAPERVHVVWGFAKDFGLSGLKVGVLHTTGPDVRAAARALAYFAPTSTDTQALLRALLADTDWVRHFLTEATDRLAAAEQVAADALREHGIPFVRPEAGFSVWLDLRDRLARQDFDAERALWDRVLGEAKVNILPGAAFGAPDPGWFRLCYATDAGLVRTGVARLALAIDKSTMDAMGRGVR